MPDSAMRLIQRTTSEAPMYYIGLDIHKKTISYCVKDASGQIHREGKIGSARCELDSWIKTLPQPRMIAMEATIFTGWIYDHMLPRAAKVKVANPLMVRAIAAAELCPDPFAGTSPAAGREAEAVADDPRRWAHHCSHLGS